ncbi:hypothetical protein BH10PLA1_BH10PLA1_01430 [soil metagenome]
MAKEMLINVSEGEECRIALLDDDKLEELYMERHSATSHVGNIYKGKVTNVEASIQAAFIDFGLGRNGFLHISDLMPTYFGRGGGDYHETVGRKMARRDRPPIQRCLRRGDEIIVQIIKEGIGTKGPTLTTSLSIPGRILVMMPGMGKMGVSKKIEDDEERRRLRQILDGLKPPKDVGFIIRTAGIDRSKLEIERDLKYLTRLWENIEKKRESGPGAMELYTEGDLITRTVRDVFTNEIDRIVVDNKDVAKRIKEFIKITAPRTRNKVEIYEEMVPLFHKYGIEREIEEMYSRHVPLPSGGSLVIDSTEAVVAIDINSGKFREHNDAELTAFKTDMEAADEIPRQLKLRDLGGVIICDFIDLRFDRHRRELEERLHENLKKDRAKTKVLRMSQFGIIEMTRQRMRPSLKRSIYADCPHCKGAGLVKTPESMALDVMRRLAIAVNDLKVIRVELTVCVDVAFYLQNKKRSQLAALEQNSKKSIVIKSDSTFGLDEIKLDLFDSRDGFVLLEGLNALPAAEPRFGHRGGRGGRNQGRPDNRRGGQPQRQLPAPPRGGDDEEEEEDRFDLDHAEEAVEDREERMESGATEVAAALAAPIDGTGDTEIADAPAEISDEPAEEKLPARREPTRRDGPQGRNAPRGRAPQRPAPAESEREENDEDFEGVDDPTAGGSELLPRDPGAVGEDLDHRGRPRRRRGRRGGRGGGEGDRGQAPRPQGGQPRGGRNNPSQSGEGRGQGSGGRAQSGEGRGQSSGGRGQNGEERGQGGGGRNQNQGGGRGQGGQGGGGRGPGGQSNSGRPERRPPNQQQRPQLPRLSADDAFRNVDEPAPEPNGNVAGHEDEEEFIPEGPSGNRAGPPNVEGAEGTGEEGPRRRRRRRGGRRHRRRRENAEARTGENLPDGEQGAPGDSQELIEDNHSDESGESESTGHGEAVIEADVQERAEKPAPVKPARVVKELPPEEPIVRTGSSDKHYVHTEVPVDPEPVRRPRSYRDLDAIPDDLD